MKKGFSLIELLVVIMMTALLFFIALPSYDYLLRRNRMTVSINQFVAALSFARQQAIMNKQIITVCPRNNDLSCGSDWSKGLIISSNEKYLRVFDAVPGISVTWNRNINRIQFSTLGFLASQNGSFKFYASGEDSTHAKVVVLSKTGRILGE